MKYPKKNNTNKDLNKQKIIQNSNSNINDKKQNQKQKDTNTQHRHKHTKNTHTLTNSPTHTRKLFSFLHFTQKIMSGHYSNNILKKGLHSLTY